MRLALLFFLLLAKVPKEVTSLRQVYFDAAKTEKNLPLLKQRLDVYPNKDGYYYCYLAAYKSLQSNYEKNLSKKMRLFKDFKIQLNKSFAFHTTLDNRFIRFCVQSKTPKLLDYKQHLSEDKKQLLLLLGNEKDNAYKNNVKLFMEQSTILNEKEKETLKKL